MAYGRKIMVAHAFRDHKVSRSEVSRRRDIMTRTFRIQPQTPLSSLVPLQIRTVRPPQKVKCATILATRVGRMG